MTPRQRWLILGGLLVATLVAAYLVDDDPAPEQGRRKAGSATRWSASSSADAGRRAGTRAKSAESAAALLAFPEQAPLAAANDKFIDPFRIKSWYVAPPPPPRARPTAPPLPFQYLGKLTEDGQTRVFLNHQGKHLIAKVGDVIDATYTVEEIAGGKMTFLYQPLKEMQVLAIGADK